MKESLKKQIENIKKELVTLGDIRPGSLSIQYNVCGTKGCRCKANPPKKHGPYYQLSFTRKRKSKTKFIKEKNLSMIEKQMENYNKMKNLMDKWVDLAIQLSDLQIEESK